MRLARPFAHVLLFGDFRFHHGPKAASPRATDVLVATTKVKAVQMMLKPVDA